MTLILMWKQDIWMVTASNLYYPSKHTRNSDLNDKQPYSEEQYMRIKYLFGGKYRRRILKPALNYKRRGIKNYVDHARD